MATISLNDGESYSVDTSGHLTIEAFSVGATPAHVSLEVVGEQLHANRSAASQTIFLSAGRPATIAVAPLLGGEFGQDQAVRVRITKQSAQERLELEFPVVRVDGLSTKNVGEIVPDGGSYTIKAFGSSLANDLSSEAVTMMTALRMAGSESSAFSQLAVHLDFSATTARLASTQDLVALSRIVQGIAEHYSLEPVGGVVFTELADTVTAEVAKSEARIGAKEYSPLRDALNIVLTATPRTSLLTTTERTLVLAAGTQAVAENWVTTVSTSTHLSGSAEVFTDANLGSLLRGDHAGVADIATRIHSLVTASAKPAPANPWEVC